MAEREYLADLRKQLEIQRQQYQNQNSQLLEAEQEMN